MIIDNNPDTRPKHRNQLSQDLHSVRIGPVVEDIPEQIDVSLDRLFGKEVVRHEFNLSNEIFR